MFLAAAALLAAPSAALAQAAPASSVQTAPRVPLRFHLIKDGVWYSLIAEHSGKALEVPAGATTGGGAPLQQNPPTGADNQLFRFDQVRSGYFKIVVKSTGKVLEIKDNSLIDHAPVVEGDWTGAENQMFTLVEDSDGSFQIIARGSGYAFDVLGGVGAVADANPVVVYPPYAAKNHKFKLVEAPAKGQAP
jgi:hypothetical protein